MLAESEYVLDLREEHATWLIEDEAGPWLRHARTNPVVGTRRATDALLARAFDIVAAGFLLTITLPLQVLVAIAVASTSNGPVLFRQTRVGFHGQPFTCIKFRTMRPDSITELERLLNDDPVFFAEWQIHRKLTADPRVTPLGSLLRRTSLDELPQLWNVLRGDMSLVGPRPVVVDEAERYGPDLARVLSVKPGLTGLWQVSGRNSLAYDQRIALDLDYVDNQSLIRDMRVCLRTFRELAQSNGR